MVLWIALSSLKDDTHGLSSIGGMMVAIVSLRPKTTGFQEYCIVTKKTKIFHTRQRHV